MQESNFKYHIKENTDDIPSITYTLPLDGGSLKIEKEDEETFKSLFFVSPNKGIGSGEISVYWLFSPNVKTNHGGSNSDLIIQDHYCEIKAYPSHFSKVTLGRWKSDRKSRYIVNSLFSYYNLVSSPSEFFSETTFNIDHIKQSYDVLLDTSNILSSYKYIPYIDKIYNRSLEILSQITGSTSEDLAKNLVVQILNTKFSKKPGDQGYVINVIPTNPLDIYIHKIDLNILGNLSYSELRDNIDIQSNAVCVNYKIFQNIK